MPKPSSTTAKPKPRAGRNRQDRSAGLDPAIVKALAHPIRMRVLSRLNEVVASPKELAEEFGVSLPMLSYHFRVLSEIGAIELVSETQRRGAIEHHYRALTRAFFNDEDWAKLPVSSRQGVSKAVVDQALADLSHAFGAGTFDARAERHLSYTPLVLDEKAWQDISELLESVLFKAMKISERSVDRLQKAGDAAVTVPGRLTMLFYEGAPASMSKLSRRRPTRRRTT